MNHFNTVRSCIRNSNDAQLKKELEHTKFGEILSILNKLQDQDQVKVFEALNEYTAIKAFKVLSFKTRQDLIRGMHHEKAARLLNRLKQIPRHAASSETIHNNHCSCPRLPRQAPIRCPEPISIHKDHHKANVRSGRGPIPNYSPKPTPIRLHYIPSGHW
ncbi:MgtE intracellular N domain-containing protein [Hydrobacter penzbergensis]|uniref:MgtE intracellular N domain-containing protein n=1 Tax=Hydrobacter penzbergensis TaxID=1235997 RepID=A0A8X8LCV0_9BACT|nr:MgtE intracellular N domain-containing protein [Hydrobacter penzbergensis]